MRVGTGGQRITKASISQANQAHIVAGRAFLNYFPLFNYSGWKSNAPEPVHRTPPSGRCRAGSRHPDDRPAPDLAARGLPAPPCRAPDVAHARNASTTLPTK